MILSPNRVRKMQSSRVNLGGFILINQQENFKTISVLPLREVEASKFVPLWSCRGGGSGGIRGLRGGAEDDDD